LSFKKFRAREPISWRLSTGTNLLALGILKAIAFHEGNYPLPVVVVVKK